MRRRRPATIIFCPGNVGLANRLRGMLGYVALCRCLRARCGLLWTKEVACDTPYLRLFEPHPGVELVSPRRINRRLEDPRTAAALLSPWFRQIWLNHGAGLVAWRRYEAEVFRALAELRPRPRLRQEVERFAREHELAACRGFHIRTTDLTRAARHVARRAGSKRPPVLSELEGFLREIDRRPKERFFVATDDSAILVRLKRRYGERMVAYPKRYRMSMTRWRRGVRRRTLGFGSRTTEVRDGLIELMLLGRCRGVVGTHRSSFSKFAAVWGGVPYREVRGTRCVPLRLPLEALNDR